MKKKPILIIVSMLLVPVIGQAAPLPWDIGDTGSTHQQWYFNTDDNPAAPEVMLNPYGNSLAGTYEEFGYEQPVWDNGVWRGELFEFGCYIPNLNCSDQYGDVWVEIGFRGEIMDSILIPSYDEETYGSAELISEVITGDDYKTLIAHWYIEINPQCEVLAYKFGGIGTADAELDYMIVDTMCAPEPATIYLLGLSSLALLCRRRMI